jgi:hypothetical protein
MRKSAQIRDKEKGTALLLALFALLLLSAIGALMYLAAITETHIGANYSNSLGAYYAANSGLLEVRDRLKYSSTNTTPGPNGTVCGPGCGLADQLPTDIAGNANGVLYVVNNAGGEVIDPTDPNNKYFDTELCHDYNSGVGVGNRCTAIPTVPNWNLAVQAAVPGANPLPYKWVRLNMKTNRIAAPYFVDGDGSTAPLDTPVCWDGQAEQLLPGGTTQRCDANGMQNVFMLTALAATSGLNANAARRLLRFEVAPPSIRPPGAITMDAAAIAPTLGSGIPSTVVDGRAHNAQGGLLARNPANPSTPATNNKCSDVAAVATDASQSSTQIEQALNDLRKSIVLAANNTCSASGNPINGNPVCPPGLWWVRGTGSSPRFITAVQVPTGTSNNGGPGKSDGDGDNNYIYVPCTSANSNCYTNLNLAAPELMAVSASIVPNSNPPILNVVTQDDKSAPFTGIAGNQPDSSVYQAASGATLPDEIAAVKSLISASTNLPNYYSVTAASLTGSYGSATSPAIVVVTDPSLTLTTNLTGYGILVVPSDFEVQAQLNWTGIVLVRPPDPSSTTSTSGTSTPTTAKFGLGAGGGGSIIGALLIQAQTANLTTTGGAGTFRVSYSCDAIDLAFSSLPFKVVSSSERFF